MGLFKSRTDLQNLREASRIAGMVCDELMQAAQPGVSTMELETMANRLLLMNRSSAPFKSFEGFGHAICVSLNDEVISGPPSRERILKEGDLVSIAVGSCYREFYGKVARTAYLGENPSLEIECLLDGTQAVFQMAVEHTQRNNSLRSLVEQIPLVAQRYGLTIFKESGGCFIGKQLHEWPFIPNNPEELEEDVILLPGMAITLMPMMALGGSGRWYLHEDGWTQVAEDGVLSAHFAETCLMTEGGLVILTQPASSYF